MKKTMTQMKVINKYLKTEVISFGFFIALISIFFSCQVEQLTAKQIIEKAVETHGSLDAWNNIDQLSFDKETTLFNEGGSIEIKTDQFQLFRPKPKLFGKIEWESNGKDIVIVYDNEQVSKIINDSIITSEDELEKAKNSFFAAQYVIVQPFALLDNNTELTLNGVEDIEGKNVYSISVKYESDTEDSNKWTYYIDTDTFEVLFNKVELSDHTSWVENLTFNTETDFKFYSHRKSYRLNEKGEKTYLRAEYFYSNYKIIYK